MFKIIWLANKTKGYQNIKQLESHTKFQSGTANQTVQLLLTPSGFKKLVRENNFSSIDGKGSWLARGGSGLISQQSPLNRPYSFRSSYNAEQSACVGFLNEAEYFLGGGEFQ